MSDSPWPPPPATDVAPVPVEVVPRPAERHRRPLGLVAAVVAVLAVGGAGVFAVAQLTGDEAGGAADPEQLGESMIAALEREDVLGLVDLLLPGERDVVRDPLVDLVGDLGRLEVLADDATLADVGGLDIEIADPAVEVQPTNVQDISNVVLSGEITATLDGEELPLGDLLLDELPDGATDLDERDTSPFSLPVTAVEQDGRWYLSMFFTAAEQARQASPDAPPIPVSGIEPLGGARPEDALDDLVDGIAALDLVQMIGALNPGEAGALQRYAPLFLDEATSALDQAPLTWDVTEAEYTVTGDGDRRWATVDVLAIEGELDGERFAVELVDGCVRVTPPDDTAPFDSCDPDAASGDLLADAWSTPEMEELTAVLEDVFADLRTPGVTLVRTGGEWYVSPLGTVLDQLVAVTAALDRSELDRLIEAVPPALESMGSVVFGAPGPVDDVLDGGDPGDPSGGDALAQCYDLPDGDEAAACFATAIAAGTVDASSVPVEMRHPECGAASAYWEGYSVLGDAEFFAVVDAARPCFLALVEAGELEEWELGYEYTRPECFEGRNWYAVFDDAAYDERFWDCVDG